MEWLFTVPLMSTQFYLLLRPAGAQPGSLWRCVLGAIWMVGFGYFGEHASYNETIIYGAVSTLGYFVILFEVWFGPLARVADCSTNREVVRGFRYLSFFVLIGWAVYPLGYMTLPFNVFDALHLDRNLVYNFGDVVNKVGFGLVVYVMAREAGASDAHASAKRHSRRVAQSELSEAEVAA